MNEDIIATLRRSLDEKEFPVVFIFGSASQGRLRPGSDIDVAVAGTCRISIERKIEIAQQLSQALGREVDVVDLQDVHGTILKEAMTGGKVIRSLDPTLKAQLMRKLWYDQADMKPYIDRILEARRKRFLNG